MKADVDSFLTLFLGTGYDDATAERALAIGYAESGATANKVSPPNVNGTRDYGFLQINSGHFSETAFKSNNWNAQTMLQLGPNIDAGRYLSNGWKKWTPWTTFNTGAYLLFIPTAKKDVADWHSGHHATGNPLSDTAGTVAGAAAGGVESLVPGVNALGSFFNAIGQPGTWLRVGYGLVGVLLIVVAVQQIAGGTAVVKGATRVVSKGVAG